MSWKKSDATVLNRGLRKFLNELSKITDVPLYVTSGIRTPEDQARVVCENTKRENGSNLSVYPEEEANIYRENCGTEEGFNIIVEYLKQKGPKSHETGTKLDIRIKNLSEAQKLELTEAIESLGGTVLEEFNPPHFHVGVPESMASSIVTGAFGVGLKKKITEWKQSTFKESALERAANKIFVDPNCTLTREHLKIIRQEILDVDILVKTIKIFMKILGVDFSSFGAKLEDLIMQNIQKEEDQEEFSSFNIKKQKANILKKFREKGLCVPRIMKSRDVKELDYFEDIRHDESLFELFDQAIISVESNDKFEAFSSYGEIGRRQILFPNWINWMQKYKDINVYDSLSEPDKSSLETYYNNFKDKGKEKTNKDEAHAAGEILKNVDSINENAENDISKEVFEKYMEESKKKSSDGKIDWFYVACKWNTGGMNCSEDNKYANKVLAKMKELKKESSQNILLKKISFSLGKELLKTANSLDKRGDFLMADGLEKTAEKLLSGI